MAKYTTLKEFTESRRTHFSDSSSDLYGLLYAIASTSKKVSRDIQKAGLIEGMLGAQGGQNIQGEDQQKLDVIADEVFIEALEKGGHCCGIASEENEHFVSFESEGSRSAEFVVLFDPLDGSSNIDVNVSIGTIFSIYKRTSASGQSATLEDMLQAGSEQVAAGYVLYGSSTMLVFTDGNGVHGFTLDQQMDEFCLSHPDMKMPEKGRYYSMNEGNVKECDPRILDYLSYCQSRENDHGAPYSGRYIGSLVADFHRSLIKGGIYIYPATKQGPEGRLRLLYECNPLAYICEQAGGMATTGSERILDITPKKLHQRVPLFIGSKEMVERAMRFLT